MSVRTRSLQLGAGIALLSSSLLSASLLVAAPAQAASTPTAKAAYGGYAYGSTASVGQVRSGQSSLLKACVVNRTTASRNNVAATNLGALGTVGAVTTTLGTSGASAQGTSQTAATRLLGGAITVRGVTTRSTIAASGATFRTGGAATFAGLTIAGRAVSASPRANTKIEIPGVARVILNGQATATSAGLTRHTVTGLRIDVLRNDLLGRVAGTIIVGRSSVTAHGPVTYLAGGSAYGTSVNVASLAGSGPTFPVYMPCGGTSGQVIRNAAASAAVPSVLGTRGVTNTVQTRESRDATTAVLQSTITGVNLLGGVVTADSVTARSTVTLSKGKRSLSSDGTRVAGLKVNGRSVSIAASPNRAVNIAGVGSLTLRKTEAVSSGQSVYGLELKLNTRRAGLPAGTVIRVAAATAKVYHR